MHCTHGHHSLQRGESGDAVRDGATQGVGVQTQIPAPRGHIHKPGYSQLPSTLHGIHNSICEVRCTRRTSVPAVVGINGDYIARMATTHCSEVRAEMPSGMGPVRVLESSFRYLHSGVTCTHQATCDSDDASNLANTQHSHASAICDAQSIGGIAVPTAVGNDGHCIAHILTSAR